MGNNGFRMNGWFLKTSKQRSSRRLKWEGKRSKKWQLLVEVAGKEDAGQEIGIVEIPVMLEQI